MLVGAVAEPDRQEANAIETMDHALDVVIEPDGKWHWKDEDDFAEGQDLGAFTSAADAVASNLEALLSIVNRHISFSNWQGLQKRK